MQKACRWLGRPTVTSASLAATALRTTATIASGDVEIALPPRRIYALEEFPTLQRFSAQRFLPFQPSRKSPHISKPPRSKSPAGGKALGHLYHDLGVLVFAGSSDSQVARIGEILKQVTSKHGGVMPLRDAGTAWVEGTLPPKLRIYRINSEKMQIEEDWCWEEGEVSLEGLLQLTRTASQEFAQEATDKMKALQQSCDVFKLQLYKVDLYSGSRKRGLIHPTVNGPRRLKVDAHVYFSLRPRDFNRLSFHMHFYTAVTCQYLGSASVHSTIFHPDFVALPSKSKAQLPFELQRELFDEMESLEIGSKKDREDILTRIWNLENEIWVGEAQKHSPSAGVY
ncbi:Fc.00g075200.m01.CDS01 [Cosmosporella sp. VM-42]